MNPLLDALGTVGYALDTPGAYLRGALAGSPGSRMSGHELLGSYGLTSDDDPLGGLKGFGTEMVLDPLALAGPAIGAFKGIKGMMGGGAMARRLAELGGNPLERRLADLAGEHVGLGASHAPGGALDPLMSVPRRPPVDPVMEGLEIRPLDQAYHGDAHVGSELMRGDERLGHAMFQPQAGGGETRAVQRLPEFAARIPEGTPVGRFNEIGLFDTETNLSHMPAPEEFGPLAHRGLGQQMLVDAMAQLPYEWAFNSQASPAAAAMLRRLSAKGLLDLTATAPKHGGEDLAHFIMRLTPEGRQHAGTMGLVHGAVPPDPLDALRRSMRSQPESIMDRLAALPGGEEGAVRPFMEVGRRTDPDYINSVPWWHGTGTPDLTPSALDPMKTDPGGLFGRGIYKTADPKIAGEYAQVRSGPALSRWRDQITGDLVRRTKDPEQAETLDRVLSGLGDYASAPSLQRYAGAIGENPGKYTREMLNYLRQMYDETAIGDVTKALGEHGMSFPKMPGETIYEANTNLGKILDLDMPVSQLDPGVIESMRDVTRSTAARGHEGALDQMGPWIDREFGDAHRMKDIFHTMKEVSRDAIVEHRMGGDPLIKAFRELGYDALSHTGGKNMGGGRNLHQVLISLDPNDTISRVGRANQITRFDPQDIAELLRRYQGGA